MTRPDPVLGRDEVIARVRAARVARAPGIVIAAPPGLGRSSILADLVGDWRARRSDVLAIRATASSRRLRFAALSPLLTGHFDAAGFDSIVFGGALTFDLVHDAITARAAHGGFVVAIDDLHLLDEASQRVIADAVGVHDAFVVATIDETFLGLDPLTERGELPVVHLAPLSVDAVGAIVADHLAGPVDAQAWWERCRGNPTVLLDALRRPDGHGADDPVGAHLSPAARRLLAVVAVAEPFPLAAAHEIDRRGGGGSAVDELLGGGVLVVADDTGRPSVRLRHPAHGARVRRSLGTLEARRARRTALLAVRDDWGTSSATERLQLAALALDAGVDLTDDEIADVAAHAPTAGDPRLALRLARRAVEQLGRFDDLRRLADVAHEQGVVDDVEYAIGRMQAAATTDAERVATAHASAQHLLWRIGDADGAVRALEAPAVADVPEVVALRARVLATVGQPGPAMAQASTVITDRSPRVRIQAALAMAHALRRIGAPARAVATLDDGIDTVAAVTDPVLSVSHQVLSVVRALATVEAGRWREGLDRAGRAVSYAERYDEAPGRAVAQLVHGVAELEAGAPADALAPLTDAVDLFHDLQQPAGSRWALAARALAHALTGDAAAARSDLGELDRTGPHPADLFPSLEPRAQAWTLVAEARPEDARQVLRDAVERFRRVGDLGAASTSAHDLVSLGQPGDLLDLPLVDDEPSCGLRVRHARAVQQRDLAELSDLVALFERLGGLRWAAECAATIAREAVRTGSRDGSRRATAQLAELTARCSGLAIPSITTGRALSLSVREREIALLAARGLTSREIGDRLGLSVRTVDNHLARCYDKLGTRNRTELSDILAG